MSGMKTKCGVAIAVVIIISLAIVIIVPMSFSYVRYFQYGFLRRKSTGNVDTSQVFTNGRYLYGPDYEFKTFPADAIQETLDNVGVWTSDGLEVSVSARYQYFLRKEDLPLLHKAYDVYFKEVLRTSALDALKGATTVISPKEAVEERSMVEAALFKAVRERLGGKCCSPKCPTEVKCWPGCIPFDSCAKEDKGLFADVRYFQLGRFIQPKALEERILKTLVLNEKTIKEKYIQQSTLVEKETDALVKNIKNSAAEILQNATAQATLKTNLARARADVIREKARSDGLKKLFSRLNITEEQYFSSFNYLRTIKDLSNVHLSVNFQQLIMGPIKGSN